MMLKHYLFCYEQIGHLIQVFQSIEKNQFLYLGEMNAWDSIFAIQFS